MKFINQVESAMEKNNSLLCVGLDPSPSRFAPIIQSKKMAIFAFNKEIIDATHDLVCAYKPQAAYYHANAAEDQLLRTIDYIHSNYGAIPVILDSKRGDIGSTASQYALEAFERYRADAVTVNPYMGFDAIEPFASYENKGVAVLCRTSNLGAGLIQNIDVVRSDGNYQKFYKLIAQLCHEEWNTNNNLLLVIGATNPEELKHVRDLTGDMTFLVPGIGVQGGDVEATVRNGINSEGKGIIVNSSRGIIYASEANDFADAARRAALELRNKLNEYR